MDSREMNKESVDISVISPLYMGEPFLEELVNRVEAVISQISSSYEIILVNDCSPDNSQEILEQICARNPNVKGIEFSRNFGQHYAIHAGLVKSTGKWVVVMDCDLQDKPEEIINLYNKAMEGHDIVLAQRLLRKDSFLKKLSSRLFYSVFSYLTETEQDRSVANFGIYKKNVIESIVEMEDYIRYFPTMVQWVGFKKTKLQVEHQCRAEGESSYSWRKLMKLAVHNILAFSNKPLRLTVSFGIIVFLTSIVIALYYAYMYFTGQIEVLGFASLIISIWFLSGIIIFLLGILGLYIGKTFDQTKNRPVYLIRQELNFDHE